MFKNLEDIFFIKNGYLIGTNCELSKIINLQGIKTLVQKHYLCRVSSDILDLRPTFKRSVLENECIEVGRLNLLEEIATFPVKTFLTLPELFDLFNYLVRHTGSFISSPIMVDTDEHFLFSPFNIFSIYFNRSKIDLKKRYLTQFIIFKINDNLLREYLNAYRTKARKLLKLLKNKSLSSLVLTPEQTINKLAHLLLSNNHNQDDSIFSDFHLIRTIQLDYIFNTSLSLSFYGSMIVYKSSELISILGADQLYSTSWLMKRLNSTTLIESYFHQAFFTYWLDKFYYKHIQKAMVL